MTGIMIQLFNPRFGTIGQALSSLSGKPVDIFLNPNSFRHVYVWSGVWQGLGVGSIVNISVLSSVTMELNEAAIIDGASIRQHKWHIGIPALLPTIIVILILSMGVILNTGFEKVLLLMIKDHGMMAGLGTHVPETMLCAEDEDWGCDLYVFRLHNIRKRGEAAPSAFVTGKAKEIRFHMEDLFSWIPKDE